MKTEEKPKKFVCEKCCFNTNDKKDFNKHLLTSKHKMETLETFKETEKNRKFVCSCGIEYSTRAGLWKHKKKCSNELNIDKNQYDNTKSDIPLSLPLDNSLISSTPHQELINEIKELKTIVEELKSSGISSNQTINNNNNIQNNNQFNLQMYLNETCSNAINIDTFLKNITVTTENVVEIGEIGYSKGIGNLIAKHINGMKQTDKPIQTTDVKRGISWIKNKDNEWVKDEDLALGNNLILFVGDKYFRKYNVGYKTIEEWRDGQSRIHAKIIKSLHQIATTVSTDDRSGYYSKIHKIIAESTVIKK